MLREIALPVPDIDQIPSLRQSTPTDSLQRRVERVLMAGSSGVGKSTIMEGLDQDRIQLVPRYTTIPKRQDSLSWENLHVTPEEFEELQAGGSIQLAWDRDVGDGNVIKYGLPVVESDDRLPVFSTNNAFFDRLHDIPNEFLETSLIVGVFAPNFIREARLVMRSQDMPPAERVKRLDDDPLAVFDTAHVVVTNYGYFEKRASDDVMRLIDAVC